MKIKSIVALILFFCLVQTAPAENFFSACRFHYGAGNASGALMNEIDYMTGWAGSGESFNMQNLFTSCKTNNKTPVIISYIIAFTARRDWKLQDCNVGTPNLCQQGALYMRDSMPRILRQYAKYAIGAETSFGSAGKMIWCMEPDYVQYLGGTQPLTVPEAGAYMNQMLDTILAHAPNSIFSMDISPWKDTAFYNTWYAAMKVKERFTFVNTSGGQSTPGSIYFSNQGAKLPTWKWVFTRFGTPTIADAGYGVGGAADPTGYAPWMNITNLKARIPEGCIAVCQNGAPATYAADIIALRSQLPTPPKCPSGTNVIAPFETPNGATMQLSMPSKGILELVDLSGRIIYSKNVSNYTFSCDSWKGPGMTVRPGTYIIRMRGNNQIVQKKVFINK